MIDLSKDIRSLTEFKRNTAALLAELKKSGRALVLTVNGRAEVVAMSAPTFQRILDALERLDALGGIRRGLEQAKRGEGIALAAFDARIRKKHGLPRRNRASGSR